MESTIKLILHEWLRRLWLIILCAVIGFVGMYMYTDHTTVPVYSTTMKVTTLSDLGNNDQMSTAGNYINMLTLSQRRVATYLELMKTSAFYEQVAEVSGTGYSASVVGSMLSFKEVEDMGFFYVTVQGIEPAKIKAVADAIAQEMYPFIEAMLPDTAVSVVEPARLPTAPININTKSAAMKGGLIGAVLMMAIVAAIAFFDTRIKDEETLASRYDIPILGVIPDFSNVTDKKRK